MQITCPVNIRMLRLMNVAVSRIWALWWNSVYGLHSLFNSFPMKFWEAVRWILNKATNTASNISSFYCSGSSSRSLSTIPSLMILFVDPKYLWAIFPMLSQYSRHWLADRLSFLNSRKRSGRISLLYFLITGCKLQILPRTQPTLVSMFWSSEDSSKCLSFSKPP